ncbi:MAG: HesA/MoeB/ThiF family protein [Pseudomonadota bacterium]
MGGGDAVSAADRYARQSVLAEVGAAGQARLGAAHVLVMGAGGLGAPVLPYLAGAGVGRITVVDGDRVALSNLHRQILFAEAEIGEPKATAAAAALARLNPEVTVRAVTDPLDPANAEALLAGADLALDCADSFAASYALSDACLAAGVPLVSASALGLSGYAGGFCGGAPSLRALFPELPAQAARCETAGVLGPVVGILGAVQAQMALAVLLGIRPSPLGQFVTLDGAGLRFGGFRFDGASEPADALRFIAESAIAPADFVVDLRGKEEAPMPVHPAALRLDASAFGPGGPRPAAGQRAVLCCRSGLRAWRAARALQTAWEGEIRLVALGDRQAADR